MNELDLEYKAMFGRFFPDKLMGKPISNSKKQTDENLEPPPSGQIKNNSEIDIDVS